jgi:hypothetical protein
MRLVWKKNSAIKNHLNLLIFKFILECPETLQLKNSLKNYKNLESIKKVIIFKPTKLLKNKLIKENKKLSE